MQVKRLQIEWKEIDFFTQAGTSVRVKGSKGKHYFIKHDIT
jgi:hypothetical protein